MSSWTRESGWQLVWNTGGSGAYGIPQALPASKMASAGADYMTDPGNGDPVGPRLHQRHLRHALRCLGARGGGLVVLTPVPCCRSPSAAFARSCPPPNQMKGPDPR